MLYRIPGVACAAVVAKEDDKWGEVPVGFIELSHDAKPINEAEVINFVASIWPDLRHQNRSSSGRYQKHPREKFRNLYFVMS